jgi:AcrR family transcriptional regulator
MGPEVNFVKDNIKDRRVQKTRKALHEALISLMAHKKYEWVAVQNILDQANVGRSTFYMHYRDKNDLLMDGLYDLWETLHQAQDAAVDSNKNYEMVIGFSLALFQHTFGHRDLFRMLVGTNAWSLVQHRMEEMLMELIRKKARRLYKEEFFRNGSFELFCVFLASSFLSVLNWWLSQENPISPEEIDLLFRQMVVPTLIAHLNENP